MIAIYNIFHKSSERREQVVMSFKYGSVNSSIFAHYVLAFHILEC